MAHRTGPSLSLHRLWISFLANWFCGSYRMTREIAISRSTPAAQIVTWAFRAFAWRGPSTQNAGFAAPRPQEKKAAGCVQPPNLDFTLAVAASLDAEPPITFSWSSSLSFLPSSFSSPQCSSFVERSNTQHEPICAQILPRLGKRIPLTAPTYTRDWVGQLLVGKGASRTTLPPSGTPVRQARLE